jgi:translocon-associated protein subunit beta
MQLSYILLILTCGLLTTTAEEESGRILASKLILNSLIVEMKDVTIEYSLYNVGSSVALDVELKDSSFAPSDFEVVMGSLNVNWPRIAPGTNVTHVVVMKPLKAGIYNFTSAELSYKISEDISEKRVGYTSAPGEQFIMNFKDYDRKYSPHVTDWAAFAVMTLPSLGIPFLLWYNSMSKYKALSTKQKKSSYSKPGISLDRAQYVGKNWKQNMVDIMLRMMCVVKLFAYVEVVLSIEFVWLVMTVSVFTMEKANIF